MFRRSFTGSHLFLFLLLAITADNIHAQATAFTYQGKLTDAGAPANGTFDMQFKLFDTATVGTGTQQGGTVTNPSVAVSNGVFTVQLDFGGGVFSGAARYLEIGVRPAGDPNPYTTLAPRQALTSTPYTIRSISAASADTATNANQLGGISASQYVLTTDSRLSDARPPTAGSASYIQNTTSQQAASNFNISGSGTLGGTLSANVVSATTQYNIQGGRVLSVAGTNNLFAGVNAGRFNSTGNNNTFVGFNAGTSNTTGSQNSFFGVSAGENNSFDHNSFFGFNAGKVNAGPDNSFFGAYAGAANTTGSSNVFFGASTGAANSSGFNNAFFGAGAGTNNTTGIENTFLGTFAGAGNTGGTHNTFVGLAAGDNNTSGSRNAFLGLIAGDGNTTGSYNVFLGHQAGLSNHTGSNNTLLGNNANVGFDDLTHATAIGAEAVVSTSNTIALGRADGSDFVKVPGQLQVDTLSPAGSTALCRNVFNRIATCSSSLRYKTAILPFAGGLELIRRLQPIRFRWKADGSPDLGLAAEEVAAVEPLLVTRNAQGEVEGVKYDRVAVVLINALKQQQRQIKQLEDELAGLKKIVCLDHPNANICK